MTLAEVALVLLQGCVGEIDFPREPDECLLMWHIQGAKVDYEPKATARQIQRYNTIFRAKGSRRAWVMELRLDGRRPPPLSSQLVWTTNMQGRDYSRRDSVLRIVAAAEKFLDGATTHPCPEAKHYGGRCEQKRGACDPPPARAKRVQCGATAQAYYRYGRLPGQGKTIPASVARGHRTGHR